MSYRNDSVDMTPLAQAAGDGSGNRDRRDDDGLFDKLDERLKGDRPGGSGGGHHRPPSRMGWLYFLIACMLVAYAFMNMGGLFRGTPAATELVTSDFVEAVDDGRVKTAVYTVADGSVSGSYWTDASDIGDDSALSTYTTSYVASDSLTELMAAHPEISYDIDTRNPSGWTDLLVTVLPTVLLIAVMFYFMRQMTGANNKAMQFGKTNAKTNEATRPKVKFDDVAGIDEAVEELKEVRDFLADPDRFRKLGAKIPRGVLLVGPPGTGKTLLAKAVAGEAGVPFFSISGSDFVEMFVGVGASRVRDLFKEAKSQAPSIIFIDEIDAVGRQRGTGLGGGHDEREQTLNQLLVQMDGFESNDGIIVMAATNRADVLDPALLRPGRFDRQITVNPPDVRGREEIFKVHARNKPLSPEINFRNLARLTSGFTGADIENLLNEAAIFAARASRKQIIMKDIYEAFNKVIAGPAKKSRLVTEADKRITAYHEAGHAITAKSLKHADSVHEVTIIPRGNAGGYTMFRPKNDDVYTSKNKWLDQISISLGGRVAEELVIQDITPGAVGDLQQCSAIARKMVSEWGMSKLGPVYYGTEHEVFLGRDFQPQHTYSEEVAKEVDEEIKSIIDSCYKRTHEILEGKLDILHNMAKLLIERETIISSDVDMLMNGASVEEVAKAMDERQAREQRDSAGQNAAQPPARKDPPAPTSSSAEPPSADQPPSDPSDSSDSSELPH